MGTVARRPSAVRALLGLLVLQGLSAIAGGTGLTLDPTGSEVGLDPNWLDGSPFADYLVPGVILLVVLGVGPLAVAFGLLRRARWSWAGSLWVGLALVIWIAVQVAVVGYIPRPPLQLAYGLLGLAILGTALLAPVRRYLRPPAGVAASGSQSEREHA